MKPSKRVASIVFENPRKVQHHSRHKLAVSDTSDYLDTRQPLRESPVLLS